ncbi:MAG TPA: helix-turn-helix domain-containing protein [Acidimicrobiales bacterium]|jgi:excisionase family DNA binding protein|nr:helix-turn-helix domain-containing protein [Acidimicrobiales bacterium]
MGSDEMPDSVADAPFDSSSPVPEKLLSRAEAAGYLGVPVSTIYHWAKTGRLPCQVTLGGHLRFSRPDLDAAYIRSARFAGRGGQSDG